MPPLTSPHSPAALPPWLNRLSACIEPTRAPLWQQYLLALTLAGAGLLLRAALQPLLGARPALLPVFVVLVLLLLRAGSGPFMAGAALSAAGLAWRAGGAGAALDLGQFGLAVALSGTAVWLSTLTRQHTGQRSRPTDELQQAQETCATLRAQLRDAERRRDDFLAMLAHELRNPLAPLRHGLQILARPGTDPAAQAQAHATIDLQMRHLLRLLDDLLDVSRITHDRLELRKARVSLGALLEQAGQACEPALLAAGQTLHLQPLPRPLWLQADAVRLVQVFHNLLANASQYSPPGSAVTVAVHDEGDRVAVRVIDRGIGIEAALLPHIFERFTQGRPAPGQLASGLGLGLALARRLVQLHGGELGAHSAGPGQGSEFTVRLPLAEEAEAGAEITRIPPGAVPGSLPAPAPWHILVVDDNHDAAITLAMLLALSGHRTHTAHDGLQALATAEALRPDAVLLDIGMPGLDGHEVARRLRAQAWGRATVLVALTGRGQPRDRQACDAAGFDAHLLKPADHERLLGLLGELLGRRR
jgi:signal transduction histidine kinase/CheY-like chemotaxis protein